MKVPNGAYNQLYINQEQKLGSSSGTGAIVAAGDIDIAAKTIDVNGLLQSGTELKKVKIPEFSVIKKEDGNYYQVMNGVETKMEKGTTSKQGEKITEYYYINLPQVNDNTDINAMQAIRAYFKPTDASNTSNIAGEIFLFNANTSGGNITLTGNVVSTKNTGKIVLMNGYGHIDVVNNSDYNLVTNSLSVDNKMQGKLTINDFKVNTKQEEAYSSSSQEEAVEVKTVPVPDYSPYDVITQDDLTPKFLEEHADTHTAEVGENGIIFTQSGNQNGSWGVGSVTARDDGATVYSTTYTPGNDAWTMEKEGGSYSYERYIERSWIVELFCGKLYETVYVNYKTTYEVQQKAIAVNFQGFDKPEINITSKSNMVMNNSISALSGDVNITSQGSILTNFLNNVITANNINLTSNNNIGQVLDNVGTIRPLMVEIMDNGTLTAKAENNIYVRYPYSDVSNIDISGKNVQLSTAVGNMDMTDKKFKVVADDLLLSAGSVNFDISQAKDNGSELKVGTLSARANDDITFVSDDSFTVKSLISENKGNINLESKKGSIYAADSTGTYLNEHIYGGDIVLKAVNGEIGTPDKPLTFANAGIFNVQADGVIYLKSADTMYVDLISSATGSLNLNANFGIIASAITDADRVYHLYAGGDKGDMNLVSTYGNIENMLINLDGILNASAGYKGTENVAGWGDVNVSLISEIAPADETGAEKLIGTKDLKIGIIRATNNVTINSERAVKSAFDESSVSGERIIINAVGDVGEQNSAINMTANREITVLSKDGSNVYLKTDDAVKGLKINQIDTTNGEGSLAHVELTSAGNIMRKTIGYKEASEDVSEEGITKVDVSEEKITNVKAENIVLTANQNIGSSKRYFIVETTSDDENKGLAYKADKAYIKSVGDKLTITKGESSTTDIVDETNNVSIKDITSNGYLYIETKESIDITDATIHGDLYAIAENVKISEMKLDGTLNAWTDDYLDVHTSNDLHVGLIIGKSTDYTDTVNMTSSKNITNGLVIDDANISAKNVNLTAGNSIGEDKALSIELVEGNKVNVEAGNVANLNNTGAAVNYNNVTADSTKITATNDVNIANLNTDKLALTTKSENVNITGDIKTKGTIDTASKNIVVDNTSLAPYPDATVQLHLNQKPMHLIVDKSNNIRTESQNVTRNSMNTLVNKETYIRSMEGEITLASETALRNSYHGKSVVDKADDSLYNNSTVSDYISSAVGSRDYLITDDKGSLINNINAMDIIRQRTLRKSVNQNFSQDDARKKKGKGNLKKADNTLQKSIDVAAVVRK